MFLRLLVYVTLALIWTGGVVPISPHTLATLDPKAIKKRQEQYTLNPKTVAMITFPLADPTSQVRTTRNVQIWNGIPRFLAWEIASLSLRGPITIPYTEEKVTVVVAAYGIPPDHIKYPTDPKVDISPTDHETRAWLYYVVPIESPGWERGTAVWAHILDSLQAAAVTMPGYQANPMHFRLILQIASENPGFTQMLFYTVQRGLYGDIMTGYVLFHREQISSFHNNPYDPKWQHFRQVNTRSPLAMASAYLACSIYYPRLLGSHIRVTYR